MTGPDGDAAAAPDEDRGGPPERGQAAPNGEPVAERLGVAHEVAEGDPDAGDRRGQEPGPSRDAGLAIQRRPGARDDHEHANEDDEDREQQAGQRADGEQLADGEGREKDQAHDERLP